MFETITEAFEYLSAAGQSLAMIDCMNAYAISKAELEGLFYKWCWNSEENCNLTGADLTHSIQLGHIEEFLVKHGLIYEAD